MAWMVMRYICHCPTTRYIHLRLHGILAGIGGSLPLSQLGQWPNALRMDSWIAPANVRSERSQRICNPCWCRRHALSFPPSPEKTLKAYKKKVGSIRLFFLLWPSLSID